MSDADELITRALESIMLSEKKMDATPGQLQAANLHSIAYSLLAIAKLLQEQQKPTTTHIPTKPPSDLRPYDEKERP